MIYPQASRQEEQEEQDRPQGHRPDGDCPGRQRGGLVMRNLDYWPPPEETIISYDWTAQQAKAVVELLEDLVPPYPT
jgi:hypothetical protein